MVAPGIAWTSQPAYWADDFIDFVGINGSPIRTKVLTDGPFAGAGRTFDPRIFYDLGIHHYRSILKYDLTLSDQPAQVAAAHRRSGAQAMMLIDPHKTEPGEIVALLKKYPPGSISAVEGPNEVNNKFPPQDLNLEFDGRTDEAAGAAYVDAVRRAMDADPATHDLPIVAFTAIFTDYGLARPHTGFDYGAMHPYQGYDVPSSSLLMNETRFNNLYPDGETIRPFVPTECGYNVEADVANGTLKTGSLRAQALNIPMLLAEYFRHGIKRAYRFAIQNTDGYGLLEDDLETKRPAYFALKNLLSEVADARWDSNKLAWEGGGKVEPRVLLFSLEGAPPTVHTLTLQKADGTWLLLVWNEVRNFDSDQKKDIFPEPVPVSLRLRTPVESGTRVLTQNDKGACDSAKVDGVDGVLGLKVPSSVMILKLRPSAAELADKLAPAPPGSLSGRTTENWVELNWNPTAAPDLGGYFIYRNGGLIGETDGTSFVDDSSWVRPGLGYRYAVRAFDSSGNVPALTESTVRTPDKRPDLVITDVEIPAPEPGGKTRFRATVQNVGEGATPRDVPVAVTFFVDGEIVSWGGTAGASLEAGAAATLEGDGGPSPDWQATSGAHLLSVKVDDVNRVSGESNESNNVADRSFTVGTTGEGKLVGASDAAPFAIDLTREGTLDWVAWGGTDARVIVRKAGERAMISDVTEMGEGYLDATSGGGTRLTWSDGHPQRGEVGTNSSLWLNGVGHGYEFSVPADQTERILRVVVGGIEGARGKFVAHLSDGSAPDYVSTTWDGNAAFEWAPVPGSINAVYTLRFRAAAPDSKLVIRWILDGEPNRFLGQARLQAAALRLADDPH